ncbi:MAG: hypothetical protein IKM46_00645 [Clostridia bacterium]|nr:hypothetical protein [Clostridia bacterium]
MNGNTVYFSDFLTNDHTASFDAAMAYLREHPGTVLHVEPGVYTITRPLAVEAQKALMDGGLTDDPMSIIFKPDYKYAVGISFAGQRNTSVIANGVTLLVDGIMEPVSIRDCENVAVCGFTVDHKRKPYSKAVIGNVGELDGEGSRKCTFEFDPQCPIGENAPFRLRSWYFDVEKYRTVSTYVLDRKIIDPYHWEVILADAAEIHDGMEYYTAHTEHFRPAILIENAKNITLKDITIHSQPGMGIVGNRSEDITLSHVSVVPSVGHHVSTNTDATHFTSIKGKLRLENCVFEGQGDDFINVHAYYHEIIRRLSDDECCMQEKTPDGTHAQSLDYPDVGDFLELTDMDTLTLVDTFRVVESTPMRDEWCCRVKLDHALPENTEGLVLADVTRLPSLEIVNCSSRTHYARGIMLKTRNVLIENNIFHAVEAPAVFAAPEAEWYEGVSPANVVIRGNRIVKCGEKGDVQGGIVVLADTKCPNGQCMLNIVIEDNIIDCPNTEYGIYVRNTNGVKVARNKINCKRKAVEIICCTNVDSDAELA